MQDKRCEYHECNGSTQAEHRIVHPIHHNRGRSPVQHVELGHVGYDIPILVASIPSNYTSYCVYVYTKVPTGGGGYCTCWCSYSSGGPWGIHTLER